LTTGKHTHTGRPRKKKKMDTADIKTTDIPGYWDFFVAMEKVE
jgi:hypothetical protein